MKPMPISKAVCLNVDRRDSERERISAEFKRWDLDVNFFRVGNGELFPPETYGHIDVTPPAGRVGYAAWASRPNSYNAFLSFRKMIEQAEDEGAETLLVLEDDVTLLPDFGDVVSKAYEQLGWVDPAWDMLYLGANHTWAETADYVGARNLLKLNGGSFGFHCVVLNRSVFGNFLALDLSAPIDELAAKIIQPRKRCYGVWPNVGLQKPGFSHCEGTMQDYTHLFLNKGRNHQK